MLFQNSQRYQDFQVDLQLLYQFLLSSQNYIPIESNLHSLLAIVSNMRIDIRTITSIPSYLNAIFISSFRQIC